MHKRNRDLKVLGLLEQGKKETMHIGRLSPVCRKIFPLMVLTIICWGMLSTNKAHADVMERLFEYGTKKVIDKALDSDDKKYQEGQINRPVGMTTQQIQTSIKSAVVLLGYKEAEALTSAYAEHEAAYTESARESAMRFFTVNPAINNLKQIHALVEKMHASVQSIGLTGGQMVKFQEFTIFLHETGQASFLPRVSDVTVEIYPQKKYLALIVKGKALKFRNGKIKIRVTLLDEKYDPLEAQPGFDSEGRLGRAFVVNANGQLSKINQKFAMPLSLIPGSAGPARTFRARVHWHSPENNIAIERTTDGFYIYEDQVSESAPVANQPKADKSASDKVEKNKFTWSAWGGYNFFIKNDYIKSAESLYEGTTYTTNRVTNTTLGGIAAGVDLLYGGRFFQGGLSAGYLPGYRFEKTFNDLANNKYSITAQMDFIPVLLIARTYLISGLYLGAGAGVSPSFRGQQAILTNGLSKAPAPGVPSEITQNVYAWTFQGRVGFDIPLGENLAIGLMGAFTYMIVNVDQAFRLSSTGVVSVGTTNYSGWMITPALVFSFKW